MVDVLQVRLDPQCMTLRLRIEVQVNTLDDQFGTPDKQFVPVSCDGRSATVLGRVETLSGRELEFARKLFPTATHRVTIPFLRFLTMRHRFVIVKNERVLEIGHLDNVEMQDVKHVCQCEEVVAVGSR
jgi:head-tail adaptor